MTMWQAMRAILYAIVRDKGLLPFFVLAVPIYSFFYPSAYQTEAVRGVKLEIVDLDASAMSRQMMRDIAASPGVQVLSVQPTIEQARRDMADGRCAGVAIIPANFYRDVLRNTPTTVEVWGTGAFPVQSKAVLETVGAVVQNLARQATVLRMVRQGAPAVNARIGREPAPVFVEQNLFNVMRGYGSYVVAAVAVLIVQQVLLIGIAALVGTLYENAGAPFFMGKGMGAAEFFGAWFMLSLLVWPSFLYMFGFVFWYQDYPRAGNVGAMVAFAGLMACVVAAMGMALGALLGNRERVLQAMLVTSIPMLFLSGAMYPREAIPIILKWFFVLIPTTPGMEGFIQLNQMAAQWYDIRVSLWQLVGIGLFYLLLAWLALQWRVGKPLPAPQSGTETRV